jgi:hypothetical protein
MDISSNSWPETSGPQLYILEEVSPHLHLCEHIKPRKEGELYSFRYNQQDAKF